MHVYCRKFANMQFIGRGGIWSFLQIKHPSKNFDIPSFTLNYEIVKSHGIRDHKYLKHKFCKSEKNIVTIIFAMNLYFKISLHFYFRVVRSLSIQMLVHGNDTKLKHSRKFYFILMIKKWPWLFCSL